MNMKYKMIVLFGGILIALCLSFVYTNGKHSLTIKVLDSNDNPVISADVLETNTLNGVQTDSLGNCILELIESENVGIKISHVEFCSVKMKFNKVYGDNVITINMSPKCSKEIRSKTSSWWRCKKGSGNANINSNLFARNQTTNQPTNLDPATGGNPNDVSNALINQGSNIISNRVNNQVQQIQQNAPANANVNILNVNIQVNSNLTQQQQNQIVNQVATATGLTVNPIPTNFNRNNQLTGNTNINFNTVTQQVVNVPTVQEVEELDNQ